MSNWSVIFFYIKIMNKNTIHKKWKKNPGNKVLDWLSFEPPFQAMSLWRITKPWSFFVACQPQEFLFALNGDERPHSRSQGEMSWRLRKMSTVTKNPSPPYNSQKSTKSQGKSNFTTFFATVMIYWIFSLLL